MSTGEADNTIYNAVRGQLIVTSATRSGTYCPSCFTSYRVISEPRLATALHVSDAPVLLQRALT